MVKRRNLLSKEQWVSGCPSNGGREHHRARESTIDLSAIWPWFPATCKLGKPLQQQRLRSHSRNNASSATMPRASL
jgi:hypothetical protein